MSSSISNFKSAVVRKALCFIFAAACFLACDRLLYFLASQAEDHFNHYLAELITRKHIPPSFYSTLIFGSSRTYRGIHPLYFWKKLRQKALKEASAYMRLKYDFLFYRQFRERHGKPRLVVLGLDYFMFRFATAERALLQLDRKYARVNRRAGGVSLLLANKPRFDQLLIDMLNQLDAGQKVKKRGAMNRVTHLIDPFVGNPHQPGVLKKKKTVDFNRVAYHPFPGEEGEYLLKLLKELHRDGVTAILVTIPEYIGTYETNFEQEKFIRDIEHLIRPYPNTHLLNYNNPAVFPLQNARNFLDGGYGNINSHLSLEGAKIFNAMLLKDLRKYYH